MSSSENIGWLSIETIDNSLIKSFTSDRVDQYGEISNPFNEQCYILGKISSIKFARENNEAVVFGKISKIRRGHYETEFSLITEEPTLEENNFIMECYKDMLEAQIKNSPAYYLWSHKRWKQSRPDTLKL